MRLAHFPCLGVRREVCYDVFLKARAGDRHEAFSPRGCVDTIIFMAKTSKKEEGSEKQKATDIAIAQIQEKLGSGSIMLLGDARAMDVEAVPTGCLSLDIALGVGGVPQAISPMTIRCVSAKSWSSSAASASLW